MTDEQGSEVSDVTALMVSQQAEDLASQVAALTGRVDKWSANGLQGLDTAPLAAQGRNDGYYRYDFGLQGGATGTYALRGPTIPRNCYIVEAVLIVLTALADGGPDSAGIHLKIEAVDDLVTFSNPSEFPLGIGFISPTLGTNVKRFAVDADVGTVAGNYIKTTQPRTPSITIDTRALTAGKFDLYLRWLQAE